jgi:DNA-binding transcriptional MerR regulator
MKYFTMVEMAKIIGIPESTARGYRDRFPSYMITNGQGRGKRYTEEALEALRIVATMSREGVPSEDIETALEARFGVMVESQDSQPQTAVSSSRIVANETQALASIIMNEFATMREQITALQVQLEVHDAELKTRDAELENRDESRNQQLTALIREIHEMRQEMRRPWWKKLFRR